MDRKLVLFILGGLTTLAAYEILNELQWRAEQAAADRRAKERQRMCGKRCEQFGCARCYPEVELVMIDAPPVKGIHEPLAVKPCA